MSMPFRLMGIVNVTPDSFSDGGLFLDAAAAVRHGRELVGQGADILDVGGESTRPGAEPVGEAEELRRVVPVIQRLAAAGGEAARRGGAGADIQISIDTSKAAVARAALAAGASLVNDVSAFRADPAMAAVVAESGADCCLMHMLGEPRTMQHDPRYEDVVDDVKAFLEERLRFAIDAGVREERVLLDPGIGFGKTLQHNLELLRRLDELTAFGRPLVIGTSRKSFLGRLIADARGRTDVRGSEEPAGVGERLPGTIATSIIAFERGATVFRVHDVAPVHAALAVTAATLA
ncbi:MAG TPA: dihydropteroate synthase [Solirubrobacteraceae bacterium]|jgi:dihydropteroate synthase|nr:dihydropteroate synthase [Solirubrobacteraceae bacterium]